MGASKAITLTIQSALNFKADSTCTCRLNTKKTKHDQVVAKGVRIESGAQFNFKVIGNKELRVGKSATVISNTSANPISGTFSNLPDGSTFTVGPQHLPSQLRRRRWQRSHADGRALARSDAGLVWLSSTVFAVVE